MQVKQLNFHIFTFVARFYLVNAFVKATKGVKHLDELVASTRQTIDFENEDGLSVLTFHIRQNKQDIEM